MLNYLTINFLIILLGKLQTVNILSSFGVFHQNTWCFCFFFKKLFKTLLFESTNERVEDSCCKEDLTEKVLIFIEECFDPVCNLTDVERGTVTYVPGYVTRKEFEKIVSLQTMRLTQI